MTRMTGVLDCPYGRTLTYRMRHAATAAVGLGAGRHARVDAAR